MSCTVFKSGNAVDQSINVYPPQNLDSQIRILRNHESDTPDTYTFRKDEPTTFKEIGGKLTCAAIGVTVGTVDLIITTRQDAIVFKLDEGREYGYLVWSGKWGLKGMNIGSGAYPDYSIGLHADKVPTLDAIVFASPLFNQNVSSWDVSEAISAHYCFTGNVNFNRPLTNWKTSKFTTFASFLSGGSKFNQQIKHLDFSSALDVSNLLNGCVNFNQPVDGMRFPAATSLAGFFNSCTSFNQPVDWYTPAVQSIEYMFYDSGFNSPININTANVFSMSYCFAKTRFNQILNIDVGKCQSFTGAFSSNPEFNQDISNFNISSGIYFDLMFSYCTKFNQDLSRWCSKFNVNASINDMLSNCGMSPANYDKFLNALWLDIGTTRAEAWRNRTTARILNNSGLRYTAASAEARSNLIGAGWTIVDGGLI
ncbi:BspA family leucine-rich repeat surface protein [Acinetobacter baumannii]|nr:BspA family leucine-rich repeat surface protein [Acinetobacter baumannii]